MAKKIILLSDGTGNAAGKVWRTNVWRIFQALDLKGSNQIVIYDDGVGSSSFMPAAILGGVFGWGLQRNVLDLYKFLCRNYDTDDKIYAFGFSRGAFTIRVLIGLVLSQGLVDFADEADLDKKIRAAYRAYRFQSDSRWNLQTPCRFIHVLFDKLFYKSNQRTVSHVDFLGLWDTVAAYGFPIDEMTRGVSQWIWPLELPNREFNPKILKARHALAIDDERATFHPVLWNETPANTCPAGTNRPTADEQLLQVWFVGVHSNVGGGYPDDSLANVSLSWMMAEAEKFGLTFKEMQNSEPDAVMSADSAKDKDGRLYNSRSGLGGYYRYSPRKISDFYNAMPAVADGTFTPKPKIHESVFGRINIGAHLYAPVGLPAEYEVVRSGDVTVQFTPPPPKINPVIPAIVSNGAPISETTPEATTRHDNQEDVWDLVWRRRVIYFLSVFSTIYLFAYPLYRDSYPFEELRSRLRIVADAIHLISGALPNFAQRWIVAYDRDPAWFLVWVGLVAFLIFTGSSLAGAINDRMRSFWTLSMPGSRKPTIAEPARSTPYLTIFLSIFFAFSILYQIAYHLKDILQLSEHTADYAKYVPEWQTPSGWKPFHDALVTYTATPVSWVLGLFLFVTLLPGPAVRKLRQAVWYQWLIKNFKNWLAPAVSALVMLIFAIGFLSHIVFNLEDSFGLYCDEKLNAADDKAYTPSTVNPNRVVHELSFNAKDSPTCLSTGVYLEKYETYYLEVARKGEPWKFFDETTAMGGAFLVEMPFRKWLTLSLLYPLRRTLDRPWGALIFRVGSKGSEEDLLDPDAPRETDDILKKEESLDEKEARLKAKTERRSEGFQPPRSGELFFYVNKPMWAIPGHENWWSQWIKSEGEAVVRIYRDKPKT